MNRLEDMSILEKVTALEACIAKADLDVEYSITVAWGTDQSAEEVKSQARIEIANAKQLFSSGRIDTLDYDVRADAYANWNVKMDNYLRKFPEYSEEKEMFKPKSM